MSHHHQRRAAALRPIIWSATDHSANIVTSGGGLIATSMDGNIGTFRATRGISSGTATWTVNVNNDNAGDSGAIFIGIADAAHPLTERVGRNSSGQGWGIVNNSTGSAAGWHNNGSVSSPFTFGTGDVLTLTLDMGAGTLAYKKNGGSSTTVFSGITGTVYPTCTIYTNGGQLTANFG